MKAASVSPVAAQKVALRARALRLRAQAAAENPGAASAACDRLLDAVPFKAGTVVSAYVAMRAEMDAKPIMLALSARGVQLCLPKVVARGAPLAFLAWRPDTPMGEGAFGAMIPLSGEALEPEILILPLLAWDRRFRRLGYGGGFYDRTLGARRALSPAIQAIGLAYAAQEYGQVPCEPTDMRLDAIVTEREFLTRRDRTEQG